MSPTPPTLATDAGAAVPDSGTTVGAPRRILRAEGAVLLAAAVGAYVHLGLDWSLFAVLVLAPDLFMLGYLRSPRFGASLYNLGHTTLSPAALAGLGWWMSWPIPLAIGLIWLAHVGFDRLAGYGLKYPDRFTHTHLGSRRSDPSAGT
jgi:hypothetical protein